MGWGLLGCQIEKWKRAEVAGLDLRRSIAAIRYWIGDVREFEFCLIDSMRLSRLSAHRHHRSGPCTESPAQVSPRYLPGRVRLFLQRPSSLRRRHHRGRRRLDDQVRRRLFGPNTLKHFGLSSLLLPRPPSRPDVRCRRRYPQALDARH